MITQKEFLRAADRAFEFLRKEYRFGRKVDHKDREDLTVRYGDRRVGVEVILEGAWTRPELTRAIRVMMGPLENGKTPEPFDPGLHRRLVRYNVRDLAALHDATWLPPTKQASVSSRADAEEVLEAYASALRTYGGSALRGDSAEYARLADATRRRLIDQTLSQWSMFVDEVRSGYSRSIAEYVDGVNLRDQLQTFLQRWSGDRTSDPVERVREVDDRFLEATEPLPFDFDLKKWQVLPMPTARDWWRKPKVLHGALRQYFAERGQA